MISNEYVQVRFIVRAVSFKSVCVGGGGGGGMEGFLKEARCRILNYFISLDYI